VDSRTQNERSGDVGRAYEKLREDFTYITQATNSSRIEPEQAIADLQNRVQGKVVRAACIHANFWFSQNECMRQCFYFHGTAFRATISEKKNLLAQKDGQIAHHGLALVNTNDSAHPWMHAARSKIKTTMLRVLVNLRFVQYRVRTLLYSYASSAIPPCIVWMFVVPTKDSRGMYGTTVVVALTILHLPAEVTRLVVVEANP
jgi:hypothetical protein